MDFFEEFSGLGELKSAEARRRRLWLGGAAALCLLAMVVALVRLGYI